MPIVVEGVSLEKYLVWINEGGMESWEIGSMMLIYKGKKLYKDLIMGIKRMPILPLNILKKTMLLLLSVISYWVLKEEVIYNAGSGEGGNNINLNLNMEIKEALKIGAMGGAAAAMVKYCPPQSRPAVALGLGTLGAMTIAASKYFDYIASINTGGGTGVTATTKVGEYKVSISSGESSKGVSKLVLDSVSEICTIIKGKLIGVPINCSGSSWNPIDKLDEWLIGFSYEEKFFISIVILLLVALYNSIGIMLSIITRLILNKPLSNKYMEKLRIWWSQSNNVILIVLFISQWFGIINSIYWLCAYIELIHNR